MKYNDFKYIMSEPRMNRYLQACNGNSRKAMTLYRLNLKLSQQMFTVISCFEIALRNAIDRHYSNTLGADWLRNAVVPNGMFSVPACRRTKIIVKKGLKAVNHNYTHHKVIAEMDFGFWRYLFAKPQFNTAGKSLLQIFPAKPKSTSQNQYNQSFIFNELEKINNIRNRIAHHEAICFQLGHPVIDTSYVSVHYSLILNLFNWLNINESELLYGLDHVHDSIHKINSL